jgi:hypothetical protein
MAKAPKGAPSRSSANPEQSSDIRRKRLLHERQPTSFGIEIMDDALTAHDPLQRRSWATTLAQERYEFGCETPRCRDTWRVLQYRGASCHSALPASFPQQLNRRELRAS